MNGPVLTLRAAGSHLYPGARGSLDGPPPAAPTACLVEFADGSVASGTIAPDADALWLATGPYTTARDTRIPAKRWRISLGPDGFRILGRARPGAAGTCSA